MRQCAGSRLQFTVGNRASEQLPKRNVLMLVGLCRERQRQKTLGVAFNDPDEALFQAIERARFAISMTLVYLYNSL